MTQWYNSIHRMVGVGLRPPSCQLFPLSLADSRYDGSISPVDDSAVKRAVNGGEDKKLNCVCILMTASPSVTWRGGRREDCFILAK